MRYSVIIYGPLVVSNQPLRGISHRDAPLARADWNWMPDYDVDKFFDEYFLPEIRKRYGKGD